MARFSKDRRGSPTSPRLCSAWCIQTMKPILLVHDQSLFPSPPASSVSRSARISTTRLCRGNTVLSNRVSARHAVLHPLIYPSTLRMAGMVSSSPPPVTIAEKDCVAKWMPSAVTHSDFIPSLAERSPAGSGSPVRRSRPTALLPQCAATDKSCLPPNLHIIRGHLALTAPHVRTA